MCDTPHRYVTCISFSYHHHYEWSMNPYTMWHDALICVISLIDMRLASHSHTIIIMNELWINPHTMRHDALNCVIYLIDMSHLTHSHTLSLSHSHTLSLSHAHTLSRVILYESCHTYKCVMHMCDMPLHMSRSPSHTLIQVTYDWIISHIRMRHPYVWDGLMRDSHVTPLAHCHTWMSRCTQGSFGMYRALLAYTVLLYVNVPLYMCRAEYVRYDSLICDLYESVRGTLIRDSMRGEWHGNDA